MMDNHNTLIQATRHEVWGWPAVMNLLMGGTAAGYFLLSLVNLGLHRQTPAISPLLRYPIIAVVLIAAGLFTVRLEVGRPKNSKFLVHHLRRSWMSREVLSASAFILFALLDWVYPLTLFKTCGAVAAIAFLFCQGMMVSRSRSVTAWNNHLITGYYMISGATTGFGFLLLWSSAVTRVPVSAWLYACGLILLIINTAAWFHMIKPKSDADENRATVYLRDAMSMTLSLGVGLLIPIMLIMANFLMAGPGFADGERSFLCIITGVCILAGGAVQKTAVLLQSNALRPIRADRPDYHVPPCGRP